MSGQAFAKRIGFEIADGDWYYDATISDADPIEGRATEPWTDRPNGGHLVYRQFAASGR